MAPRHASNGIAAVARGSVGSSEPAGGGCAAKTPGASRPSGKTPAKKKSPDHTAPEGVMPGCDGNGASRAGNASAAALPVDSEPERASSSPGTPGQQEEKQKQGYPSAERQEQHAEQVQYREGFIDVSTLFDDDEDDEDDGDMGLRHVMHLDSAYPAGAQQQQQDFEEAIWAAWPGSNPQARILRCSARLLGQQPQQEQLEQEQGQRALGPNGPHTMLCARCCELVRRVAPDAVAALPQGMRLAEVLNEHGAGAGGTSCWLLRVIPGRNDRVVELNVEALLGAARAPRADADAGQPEAACYTPQRQGQQGAGAAAAETAPAPRWAAGTPSPGQLQRAIKDAWPDADDALSSLRRAAACTLAAVANGPAGPHSKYTSQLAQVISRDGAGPNGNWTGAGRSA